MEYSAWVLKTPNLNHVTMCPVGRKNIKGQNGAEGHAGATNVLRALEVKRCFTADEIKIRGEEQSSYFHLASSVRKHQLLHSLATKITS